jgi:hypothetical protein
MGVCLIRWKDVNKPWVDNPAFIVHYAGCSMCNSWHPERLGECDVEYIRIFTESFGRLIDTAREYNLAPRARPTQAELSS